MNHSRTRRVSTIGVLAVLLALSFGGVANWRSYGLDEPERKPYLIYFDEEVDLEALEDWFPEMEIVEPYDAFVLADLTADEVEFLEFEEILLQDMADITRVGFPGASFDTEEGEPDFSAELTHPATGDGWYVVQFIGPVKDEWRDDLESLGSGLLPVPNCACLVYLTEEERESVVAWSEVRWVGRFHPGYRLPPELEADQYLVRFFPGHATAGLAELQLLGLTIVEADAASSNALVEATSAQLEEAAALDEVLSLTAHVPSLPAIEQARQNVGADVVNDAGLIGRNGTSGAAQVVAVYDTGLYRAHEVFQESGKVVAVIDRAGDYLSGDGDYYGHGTQSASVIAGDLPEPSDVFLTHNHHDGLAVGCRLVVCKIFYDGVFQPSVTGGSLADELREAYEEGARVSSLSLAGTGKTVTFEFDEEVWEYPDHVVVLSAGNNSFTQVAPFDKLREFDDFPFTEITLSPHAHSKNAIIVGACDLDQPANVERYSSYGPGTPGLGLDERTSAGRIKPDLMAPVGLQAASTSTEDTYDFPHPAHDPHAYQLYEGTSCAAPVVSAGAALVRQYFMDGYYPTGSADSEDAFTPSSALVKAVLINGAEEITGDLQVAGLETNRPPRRWPNSYQGWGRMNLDRSLYFDGDDRRVLVWDDPEEISSGEEWSVRVHIDSGNSDAKFTLVWIDAPATAPDYFSYPDEEGDQVRTGQQMLRLVNDLHLRVVAADGTVFWGNNFTDTDPGFSEPRGEPNTVDNVEGVHLVPDFTFPNKPLPVGDYTIYVTGGRVEQAGSKFALVVSGDSVGPAQGATQSGSIAVMGDYRRRIQRLLEDLGYAVRAYPSDDSGYQELLSDFALGSIDVVILNRVRHGSGTALKTNGLMATADQMTAASGGTQRGILFLGLQPINQSGMYAHEQWARVFGAGGAPDPTSLTSSVLSGSDVSVTPLVATDPLFKWLPPLPSYPILRQGGNSRAYQSYANYSGTSVAGNPTTQPGQSKIVGTRLPTTVASRHVLMGGFGSSAKTNLRHWVSKPTPPFTLQMFTNALEWSRGITAPPVQFIARVGVMGDYNGQIESYLVGLGYTVTSYGADDYTEIEVDVAAEELDIVVLNAVEDDAGFDDLIDAADAVDCGIIFLSPHNESGAGLGVLSSRSGDPESVDEASGSGKVQVKVTSSTAFLSEYSVGKTLSVIHGVIRGSNKRDYATFTLGQGTQWTAIGESKMDTPGKMLAYRDRNSTSGLSRQVVLAPLGVSKTTHLGHWTLQGKLLFRAAIEWARAGAP